MITATLAGTGGAALVGIEDAAGYTAASNVETALVELYTRNPGSLQSNQNISSATTQVTVDGFNSSVTIAPSVDNVLSGTVTVTLEDAPDGTNLAFFTIAGPGISEEGPNLGIDSDSSGGWSRIVDTTEYENGVYDIGALAMPSADDNPLGTATAQVVIEN